MARRGPLPLPNSSRLDTQTSRRLDQPPATADAIEAPPVDDTWHARAQVWFLSLVETPQAAAYTRADWGHAYMAAGLMSDALRSGDLRCAAAVLESAGQRLMTTRPARLAARLDVDEGDRPAGEVLDLPTDVQLRAKYFGRETG